eukprot:TRINITY_DN26147_c0_g1_i1.p1 TRINITY_DN26147_c0_g1~~TRINITY_DN26147_c0_g1_i1.p1  ORF type:complete len:446 (+),score=43.77 TRINITY_DN26147_c0_g1_i1:83-1420(+)
MFKQSANVSPEMPRDGTPLSEAETNTNVWRQQVAAQNEVIQMLCEKVAMLEGRLYSQPGGNGTPLSVQSSVSSYVQKRGSSPPRQMQVPTASIQHQLPPIVKGLTNLINDTLGMNDNRQHTGYSWAGQVTPRTSDAMRAKTRELEAQLGDVMSKGFRDDKSHLYDQAPKPAAWDLLERDLSVWKAKIQDLSSTLDAMAGYPLPRNEDGTYQPMGMTLPDATEILPVPDQSVLSLRQGQQASPVTSPTPHVACFNGSNISMTVRDLDAPSEAREKLQEHANRLAELLSPEAGQSLSRGVNSRERSPRTPSPARGKVAAGNPRRPRREDGSVPLRTSSPRLVSPSSCRGSPSPSKAYRPLTPRSSSGYPQRDQVIKQVHERLSYLSKQIGGELPIDRRSVSPRVASPAGVVPLAEYASEDQLRRVQRFRERKSRAQAAMQVANNQRL